MVFIFLHSNLNNIDLWKRGKMQSRLDSFDEMRYKLKSRVTMCRQDEFNIADGFRSEVSQV